MIRLEFQHLREEFLSLFLVAQAKFAERLGEVGRRVLDFGRACRCALGTVEAPVLRHHCGLAVLDHLSKESFGFSLSAQFPESKTCPVAEVLAALEVVVLVCRKFVVLGRVLRIAYALVRHAKFVVYLRVVGRTLIHKEHLMVLRVGEGLVVKRDGRLSISLPEFLLAGKHAGINEIVVEVRIASKLL